MPRRTKNKTTKLICVTRATVKSLDAHMDHLFIIYLVVNTSQHLINLILLTHLHHVALVFLLSFFSTDELFFATKHG